MIDMRGIWQQDKFKSAIKTFTDENECSWNVFKDPTLEFTNCKCPICEGSINKYDDMDHYRPKADNMYPFLRCCYKNYMMMCDACNRKFKRVQFPLYTNFKATNIDELKDEYPLLINPMYDDIYKYFNLNFVNTSSSKQLLILEPIEGLSDYDLEKAKKTIEVYGIGNCDDNDKIDICRIAILSRNFNILHKVAKLRANYLEYKDSNIQKSKMYLIAFHRTVSENKLEEYGFHQFLLKDQFNIAV